MHLLRKQVVLSVLQLHVYLPSTNSTHAYVGEMVVACGAFNTIHLVLVHCLKKVMFFLHTSGLGTAYFQCSNSSPSRVRVRGRALS